MDLLNKRFGKLTVLEKTTEKTKSGKRKWLCQCDCGNKVCITGGNLISNNSKTCGCSKKRPHNFKDLTGQIFGKLEVLERKGERINDIRLSSVRANWLCKCLCGKVVIICSKELLNGHTESCGCFQKERASEANWKGYGEISSTYFTNIKKGAKLRKLKFEITLNEIWDLFLKQERKCSLTGLELIFSRDKTNGQQTASLDRIDSTKDYTLDNLQWVHKIVQFMKNKYSQEEYIKYCKLVTDYQITKGTKS